MAQINRTESYFKKGLIALATVFGVFLGSFSFSYAVSTFIVQQGGTGVNTLPISQLVYGSGTNPVGSVATTSVSCSGSVSCSSFTAIGASPITITASGGSSYPFTTNTNFGVTVSATSTPIWDTAGIFASSTSNFLHAVFWGNTTLTNATSTNFFSTTASSTNLFGANINGFGLSSCTGTNALTWSGGSFSCTAQPQGTVTAVSVATANGFTGSSSGGATPALTITTNQSGLLQGNGTAITGIAGTAGQFPYYNGANTLLATSNLFLSGTNIGVGTTSPWATLSVGSANATTQSPLLVVASSSSAVGTSTLFVISGNGNVGIGTSTPGTFFSVQGVLNALSSGFITFLGEIVGKDTVNGWFGRISPTHSFVLGSATSTTWTASTTNSGYSPFLSMPFAGTLQQMRCLTDQSFLGVNVQVNGSNATPSYVVSSTTAGVIVFTSGNTFTLGQKILANFGTTTTSSTLGVNCTFDVTETP